MWSNFAGRLAMTSVESRIPGARDLQMSSPIEESVIPRALWWAVGGHWRDPGEDIAIASRVWSECAIQDPNPERRLEHFYLKLAVALPPDPRGPEADQDRLVLLRIVIEAVRRGGLRLDAVAFRDRQSAFSGDDD